MHKTQLYLEESQYLILRDWAAKRRKSIAQIVRDMIDAAISSPVGRKGDSLDGIVGLGASGLSNISAHVDDYLYGDPESIRALEKGGLVRDRRSRGSKRAKRS